MSSCSDGNNRSRLFLHLRLSINSDGDTPVVAWGVILYLNKNLSKKTSIGSVDVVNDPLNVCTMRSAKPFVEGLYAAEVICRIPLAF